MGRKVPVIWLAGLCAPLLLKPVRDINKQERKRRREEIASTADFSDRFVSSPLGGAVDPGPAGGQHGVRGGALPQVPLSAGGPAQLPEDRAEPGNQERGTELRAMSN